MQDYYTLIDGSSTNKFFGTPQNHLITSPGKIEVSGVDFQLEQESLKPPKDYFHLPIHFYLCPILSSNYGVLSKLEC
jgi:hypothetical protein